MDAAAAPEVVLKLRAWFTVALFVLGPLFGAAVFVGNHVVGVALGLAYVLSAVNSARTRYVVKDDVLTRSTFTWPLRQRTSSVDCSTSKQVSLLNLRRVDQHV